MFNAVLSDDGAYVTLFHEDGEIEEMELYEFTLAYGTEILESVNEVRTEVLESTDETQTEPVAETSGPSEEDVKHYWKAFRRLVKNCGQYTQKVALRKNAEEGILKPQKVAYEYFGGANSDRGLAREIIALDNLRKTALVNLDYWSHRRMGYKPMSTPKDVEMLQLGRRADTEILLDHLSKPDFRDRMYYRIDKYAAKGEPKSPTDVVLEVLRSYQPKKSRQPS